LGKGVVLAVSLDIANAFNTLPWGWIGRGLDQHQVPRYLKTIIREYFRDRRLVFRDQEGFLSGREVYCGVPQGSVLGPLCGTSHLTVYCVLRTPPAATSSVMLMTLVVAGGRGWDDALAVANVGAACVVRSMRRMGLEVASHKTEAIYFHGSLESPSRQNNG